MNIRSDAGSVTKSKSVHSQDSIDLKDFPVLKSTRLNHSPISEKKVNNVNKKSTRSYKNLFSFEHGSQKCNLNEEFPKLDDPKFKKNQKNEGLIAEKNQEKASQNTAVIEKCEDISEPLPQSVVSNQKSSQNERKKLESSKKVPVQQRRNPHKKKRSEPIFFNLGDALETNLSLKKAKQPKKLKSRFLRSKKRDIIGGNFLDSSNPKRNRGKHREIKKKKHTNLKMAILKERIIKQRIREENISDLWSEDCVKLISTIDFKVEIEKYLKDLKVKKSAVCKKNKEKPQKNVDSVTGTSERLKSNNENGNLKCSQEKIVETQVKNTSESGQQKIVEPKVTGTSKQLTETNETDSLSESFSKVLKFSSKFREYCDNIVTPNLNVALIQFIKDLVDLQDRVFARDPIKAKVKKRHVTGFREVKKYLTMKKVKMVVIAPNLEKLQMEGSIYDIIKELKTLCESQNVPCVFALDRHKLGRCTKKYVPVSAFAVLNYEGLEDRFQNVVKNLEDAKEKFTERLGIKKIVEEEDVNAPVISSFISAFKEKQQMAEIT